MSTTMVGDETGLKLVVSGLSFKDSYYRLYVYFLYF